MNRPNISRWSKLFTIAACALTVAATQWAFTDTARTQGQTPKSAVPEPPPTTRQPAERFDLLVREDIFAGLAGDTARFDKGMKLTEETLAKNPNHAEALVWHGAGTFTRAGWTFQKGDLQKGGELWQKGLDEMAAAVKLAPNSVSVLIPRAAVLLEGSKYVPMPAQARELLEIAVNDYEKVLHLQTAQGYFQKLGTHARGELLIALASGWHRLGDQDKARNYFQRIMQELPGSSYAEQAKTWLETKTLPQSRNGRSCSGCHA